jgi:hypothetical protein
MNRILSVMTLAAAFALATGTMAIANRHVAKPDAVPAQQVASARCADPSHCPFGSCPVGSKSAATVSAASAPAAGKAAACSDPAKCTTSCSQGSAGATAAVVTKR